MSKRAALQKTLDVLLKPIGYEVVRSRDLYAWQRRVRKGTSFKPSTLPVGAERYLREDNPRFRELRERYAAYDDKVTFPLVWKEGHLSADDMQYFRGDNAYVWQLRGPNMNPLAYALTAYYVASIDTLGLLGSLQENESFGNYTFQVGGRTVSRDLLDSIIELYFLDKHLNLAGGGERNVLDIGAGYGRLASRMVAAFPQVRNYLCTDAVAASTFISEYYLRFLEIGERARVLPLDEVEATLARVPVDFAVNVHSFSECRIEAVDWWLALLEKHAIRFLMVVPNAGKFGGERLLTKDGNDFGAVIERHGYELVAKEPKFRDPIVQEYGINPTFHYLFARR